MKSRRIQSRKKRKTVEEEAALDVQEQNESGKKAASENETTGKRKTRRRRKSQSKGRVQALIKLVLAAGVLFLLLGMFFFDVTRVSSNAMLPNLAQEDLVLSWSPGFFKPVLEVGDIALIETGTNEIESNFLRVLSSHRESIHFRNDVLEVSGQQLKRKRLTNVAIARSDLEPEIWRETSQTGESYQIMLPRHAITGSLEGAYENDGLFLVGDNRMGSYDSRQSGSYAVERVRGKALFVVKSSRDDGIIGHWLKPLN